MNAPSTLVIDRGLHLTGTALHTYHKGISGLRNKQSGLMCCLGFYAKDCGKTQTFLEANSMFMSSTQDAPSWLVTKLDSADLKRFHTVLVDASSTAAGLLAGINDSLKYHPKRRETAIGYVFKKYGNVDVAFTGRYADATKRARNATKVA